MPISPRPPSGTKTSSEEVSFIDAPSAESEARRLEPAHDVEVPRIERAPACCGIDNQPATIEPAEEARHLARGKLDAHLRADAVRGARPGRKMLLVAARRRGELGKARGE